MFDSKVDEVKKHFDTKITDNYPVLQQFKYGVLKILFKWLNSRSQRRSSNAEK